MSGQIGTETETVIQACVRVAAGVEQLEWDKQCLEWNRMCVKLNQDPSPRPESLREPVRVKPRRKFVALDIGTSGAWLVEKATGEIFNIKGYGVPDSNKKSKANLGRIQDVDPAFLLANRWNYLQ